MSMRNPSKTCEPIACGIPPGAVGVKEGDIFTIVGHKLTAAGWVKNCSPGEETKFIGRVALKK